MLCFVMLFYILFKFTFLRLDGFRTTLSAEETDNYISTVSQLALKASSLVRTIDDSDELTFLRIRSKKQEIMIAPDKEYCLVVIQNPQDS